MAGQLTRSRVAFARMEAPHTIVTDYFAGGGSVSVQASADEPESSAPQAENNCYGSEGVDVKSARSAAATTFSIVCSNACRLVTLSSTRAISTTILR